MTMRAHSKTQPETPGNIDFSPEMLVVRDIDVSDPANDGRVSWFSDKSWCLSPAARKSTSRTSIYFGSSPPEFRDSLKRLVYCAVNLDTPMGEFGRRARTVPRLSVGSVKAYFDTGWRPFIRWLAEQGIGSISEADDAVLNNYRDHVAELTISPIQNTIRMGGLWRMWRYAPCLPAEDRLMQPPWETVDYDDDIGDWGNQQVATSENRTPPIHPDTMSELLVWSMRFVNDFAGDILRAKQRRAEMDANVRPRRRDGDLDRWKRYLDSLRHDAEPLPGHTNSGYTALALNYLAATLDVSLNTFRYNRPSDIAIRVGAPLDVEINGQIEGERWVDAIDFYEIDYWVRRLATACVVVVAYLSGMRPEECLALKRGCCQPSDSTDELSGYEVRGLTFKIRGGDGNTIVGGVERRNSWYVIEPVARAVNVMEQLHPHELLFPVAAFTYRAGLSTTRSACTNSVNFNIRDLIEWCNQSADASGRSVIPPDPNGPVTTMKFRRTVAWFIYRRPRGLIALGSQYGHINLLQSEGYGRRAYSGMSDVLDEHAFALRDQIEASYEQLAAGEGVSGPAAERLIGAVTEYKAQFRGGVLTHRDAKTLLKNPSLQVYDSPGQHLACCYDEAQALCHPSNNRQPGIEQSPDLLNCDPRCANVARTDSHMTALTGEVQQLDAEIASPMTPIPIQVRLTQRRDRLLAVKADHEQKRHVTTPEAL